MKKSKVYLWISCVGLVAFVGFYVISFLLPLASSANEKVLGFVLTLSMNILGIPAIIAPIWGAILLVYGFYMLSAGRRDRFLASGIAVNVAVVALLAFAFVVGSNSKGMELRGLSADALRLNDLNQVRNGLEAYHNKCGYYPGGPQPVPQCGPFVRIMTWQGLTNSLTQSNLGITYVPNDPRYVSDQLWVPYSYGTNGSGTSYVIGAKLENPNDPSLTVSPSGTIDGVNCDHPVYCIEQ